MWPGHFREIQKNVKFFNFEIIFWLFYFENENFATHMADFAEFLELSS